MRALSLFLLMIVIVVLLSGCATSRMETTKTMSDGTVIEYKVSISSLGQDFSGSDLVAELDPEGKTMVRAGTVDNTMSPYGPEMAKAMVEMLRLMLPYIAPATLVVPTP